MTGLTNSPNWMHWKRYGFLLGFLPLALPIGAWYRIETTDWAFFAWLPLVVIFGLVPLVDRWMGNDLNNPEGDVVFSLGEDPWYSSLLVVVVPLQLALVFWGVGVFANSSLGLWGSLGWILSMGVVLSTVGITVGHELVHHKSRFEQACGGILLASVCNGSFKIEHVRGHHQYVATPLDASSAPMGVSVYQQIPHAITRNFQSAWKLESERLQKLGLPFWHWRNELLGWSSLSLCMLFVITSYYGSWGALGFLSQSLVAIVLLEIVNYIEHYGLQRKQLPNGRYEPVTEAHSWNSPALLTNLLLFQLQRHSDHHLYARRSYQLLHHRENAPQLPYGYGAMVVLALLPPVWFRLMDPKIVEQQNLI